MNVQSDSLDPSVYLGLAVPLADPLAAVQRAVCERYVLTPRREAHLTLAYLGVVSAADLAALAQALHVLRPPPWVARLAIAGLGGACLAGADTRLIGNEDPASLRPFPRVLWLAVRDHVGLRVLREAALRAAGRLGLDSPDLHAEFFPHLTLGSTGPVDTRPDAGAEWDVHTVPKRATIAWQPMPTEISAERLHLTHEPVHPASLHLLHRW